MPFKVDLGDNAAAAVCEVNYNIKPYVDIIVGGLTLSALIDTGAMRCFIDRSLANKIINRHKIYVYKCDTPISCVTANRDRFIATEYISAILSINKFSWKVNFIVAPQLVTPVILGCDFIIKTQLNIDIFKKHITFNFAPLVKIGFSKSIELLNQVNILSLADPQAKDKLTLLLNKHKGVITEKLGKTNILKYEIRLTDEEPVRSRFYPLSPPKLAEMDKHIKELLSKDIIEKSSSPYASPAFLIDKENGGKRLCCDYRSINKKVIYDSYPMPSVESVLQFLGNAQVFSKIDLNSSFHQVPLLESSREKTAFITPLGLYQYKYVPFGLCVSPQALNRVIDAIFGNGEGSLKVRDNIKYKYIIPFVDDICVYSNNIEEHLVHLDEVFTRLGNAGITVNPRKLELCKDSVKFLGYIISSNGLLINPDKVQAVLDYPEPKNIKQLMTFLGMTSFYSKFIPYYADIAEPLNYLKRKDIKYIWGKNQQAAFDKLKLKLTSPSVLKFPNFSKKFILQTDASGLALGAVLQQEVDGALAPIAYASRLLNPSERKRTVYELECAAVVFGVEKFSTYLEVAPFELQTDNAALSWLFEHPKQIGKLGRWILFLSRYKFEIKHIRGTINKVADALSRMYEGTEMQCSSLTDYPIVATSLQCHQINDQFCKEIAYNIKNRINNNNKFKIKNDLLFRRIGSGNKWRVVLPQNLKQIILNYYHDQDIAGHLGITKTLNKISKVYWWPKMSEDVRQYVSSCHLCQSSKPINTKPAGLMASEVPNRVWETVYIDYKGPLLRTQNGNCYILVLMDSFSKWVELIPVRAATAAATVRTLTRYIWARYGTPVKLVSDNAKHFIGDLCKQMCREWGIKFINISPHYPQANAVERVNRNLAAMLNIYCRNATKKWDEMLPKFQLALNSATHESTKCTPAYIFLGRDINLPLENTWNVINCLEELNGKTKYDLLEVKNNLTRSHIKQERYYNNKRRENDFKVGQKVLVKNFPLSNKEKGISAALAPKWLGPYLIESIYRGQAIVKNTNLKSTKRVNIAHLKHYCDRLEGGNVTMGILPPSSHPVDT